MAALAEAARRQQIGPMPPERPPVVDAEYRVVHGPWPRWAVHLGLIKLIVWGAVVSGATILIALALVAAFGAFR